MVPWLNTAGPFSRGHLNDLNVPNDTNEIDMNETLHQLNRLRPLFSRRDKLLYLGLLGLMSIGALLEVLGIGIIPAFVAILAIPDKVAKYPPAARLLDYLGISLGPQLLLLGSAVLLAVFILKNAYMVFLYHIQFRVVEYHRARLASRLFKAYIYAPYLFHLKRNSAELLRNVNSETIEIIQGVISPFLALILGFLFTALTVVLLLVVTPGAAVAGLLFLAIGSFGFFSVVKKRLTYYGKIAIEERKEVIRAVNQGLGALVDARLLGRESTLLKAFDRSVSNFARVVRLRQVIQNSSVNVLEVIAVFGMVIILVVLLHNGMKVEALIPTLTLYAAATMRLRQNISRIVGGLSSIRFSTPSVGNVVDDLEQLDALYRRRAKVTESETSLTYANAIDLRDVSFTYPDHEHPVLKNISLTIQRGESVAFVGSTGCGKSTLISLILGLIPPQSGEILVDGRDIQQNLPAWHRLIGYVPQNIFLLDDTIRNNIAFGIPGQEIDEHRLWDTIKIAQLESFVRESPQGLDTRVGERGVRISGGQRQRIGLARALYRDPEIIILDEATAALDNKTEVLLMQNLRTLEKRRTFIIVAHRLTTVENCDRLYLLEEGFIRAVGNFTELANRNESFRKMAAII